MEHHNWPAIVVAAIVAFLIGGLWYSPLMFAKAWVKAHGYSPEKLKAMQAKAPRTYGLSFLCFVLMAFVMHLFVARLGADSVRGGAVWGFHAWIGFALPLGLTAHLYSDNPLTAFLIDSAYQLVYMTVMGAILAGWP